MPCQHWNRGSAENETNAVKNILKGARADVQTLSTQQPSPDLCVPKFAHPAVSYYLRSEDMSTRCSTSTRRTCELWPKTHGSQTV